MGFHDFTGCLRGGANHHGDGAEVKMHEGAVLRGGGSGGGMCRVDGGFR